MPITSTVPSTPAAANAIDCVSTNARGPARPDFGVRRRLLKRRWKRFGQHGDRLYGAGRG